MASEATIFLGAGSNYDIQYEVTSNSFDLNDVSSAVFRVLKPPNASGVQVEQEWACTLDPGSNRTSSFLVLKHVFGVGEVDELDGRYIVEPRMTTPGGEIRAEAKSFIVKKPFQ